MADTNDNSSNLVNITNTPTKHFGLHALPDNNEEEPKEYTYTGGKGFYDWSRHEWSSVAPRDAIRAVVDPSIGAIGECSFSRCSGLASVSIPEGVEIVGERAFSYCEKLTAVELPESVREIRTRSFYNCSGLLSIRIPEGVEVISQEAFSGCKNLREVKLPSTLKQIRWQAFFGCTGLVSIDVPEGVEAICQQAFSFCENLEEVALPKTLREIQARAFYGCSDLVSVHIPEGVEVIGREAFGHCINLAEVELPPTLKEMRENAFSFCPFDARATVRPSSVSAGKQLSFSGCENSWTKGIQTIESILQPDGDAFATMTDAQKDRLEELKTVLSRFHANKDETPIPPDLMKQYDSGENGDCDDHVEYLVENFGGLKRKKRSMKNLVQKTITMNRCVKGFAAVRTKTESMPDRILPPEWTGLPRENRERLRRMLSWDNLARWDFDSIELNEASNGNPLLFVGWALLASPAAEHAMARDCGENPQAMERFGGYGFPATFRYSIPRLCAFLRSVSDDYNDVPYHNKIHAADVAQTLHSILQMGGKAYADEIEVFALLVAALGHDVNHPGTNNNFQIKTCSEHAITYNDRSCLENMHAASLFKRLLGDCRQSNIDIFSGLTKQQQTLVREIIVEAILHTDMTTHFALLGKISEMVRNWETDKEPAAPKTRDCCSPANKKRDDNNTENNDSDDKKIDKGSRAQQAGDKMSSKDKRKLLCYMLHAADISNPAKPDPVFRQWTDRMLEEFFAQGDKEKANGLEVTALCDRETTNKEKSQIGFIRFIIQPAYGLLGDVVENVKKDVVPIIDRNLEYWKHEETVTQI